MIEYNAENLRTALAELGIQHEYFGNKLADLQGELDPFSNRVLSAEEKLVERTFDGILAAEKAIQEVMEMLYIVQSHNEHIQNNVTSIL